MGSFSVNIKNSFRMYTYFRKGIKYQRVNILCYALSSNLPSNIKSGKTENKIMDRYIETSEERPLTAEEREQLMQIYRPYVKDVGKWSLSDGLTVDFYAMMTKPTQLDLSLKGIYHMMRTRDYTDCQALQYYDFSKIVTLGHDLACAHAVLQLGGGVMFQEDTKWIRAKGKAIPLPTMKIPTLRLDAVDLDGTRVMEETFDYFNNLKSLKFLSMRGCSFITDNCLRVLANHCSTLQELDVSCNDKLTEGGLAWLGQCKTLRKLKIEKLGKVKEPHLLQILLEEALPDCQISGYDFMLLESLDDVKVKEDPDPFMRRMNHTAAILHKDQKDTVIEDFYY